MTKEQESAIIQRKEIIPLIFKRERKRCIVCGSNQYLDIHEIVPRSRFGKLNIHQCFVLKNMVVICRSCHSIAHTIDMRKKLIQLLEKKYNYSYTEQHYQSYLKET